MKTAAQLMKKKAFIKSEMDLLLPKKESDAMWHASTKKLQTILERYSELPEGVQSHADSIFPAAAVYLTVKKKYGDETAYKIIENAAVSLCAKFAPTLEKIMKLPGMRGFFVSMWDSITKKKFGPSCGFKNRFYPKKKGEYRMDILACPLFSLFYGVGLP